MKHRNILFLGILLFLLGISALFASVFRSASPHFSGSSEKPDQPILFLVTYSNYAWEPSHRAAVITADGRILDADAAYFGENGMIRADWETSLLTLAESSASGRAVPAGDLRVMYRFVNAGIGEQTVQPVSGGIQTCDYGTNAFYLLEKRADGHCERRELCCSGDACGVIPEKTVIGFCNWMYLHGYIRLFELF